MKDRTRIDIPEWESNRHAGQVINNISNNMSSGLFSSASYDFDGRIESINERLRNTDFINPIAHTPINPLLHEAVNDASTIHSYISNSLRDIKEIVDDPFLEVFNGTTGVNETLELIRLDDYQIDNNLGITTTTTHHDPYMGSHEITRVKSTIGLRDIMNNDTIEGTLGMPSFTEMFQEQFYAPQESIREGIADVESEIERLTREIEEHPHLADELGVELAELQEFNALLTEQLESMESMDFNDYVNMLIHRADVHHTVDRGWRNGLSNVLDTIGIVSLVGWVSGTNFVTGERLTPAERRSAGFTALLNVGMLALGVVTGGAGTLVAKVAINIGTSMLSGVAAMATAGILDHFGAPPWLQTVGAMAAGFATGYVSGRAISNAQQARTANQIGEIANQNGLTVDQLNDVRRHLPSTRNLNDADFIRLLNEKPLDELLGLPELNSAFIADVARNNGLTIDQLNDIRRHLPNTRNLSDADFARLLNEKPIEEVLGVNPRSRIVRRITDTNGMRNEIPLTEQQARELVEYAESLGMPRKNISVAGADSTNPTGLLYEEILVINNDALPITGDNLPINSRLSGRATIAHEVVGHYEAGLAGRSFKRWDNNLNIDPVNTALDEAQASIRAARFAPGLSEIERYQLIRDGLTRLRNADLNLRDVRELLHISTR